jgi:hypothetical protein
MDSRRPTIASGQAWVLKWLCGLVVWAPAALTTIYLKFVLLYEGGLLQAGAAVGMTVNSRHQFRIFTPIQTLSFFREDILIVFLAIPMALLLFSRVLSLRCLIAVATAMSACAIIIAAVERQAYLLIGDFLSYPLLMDGLWWGLHHSADATAYIGTKAPVRLLILILVLLFLAAVIIRVAGKASNLHWIGLTKKLCWLLLPVLLLTLLAWLPTVRTVRLHRSIYGMVIAKLVDSPGGGMQSFARLTNIELIGRYHESESAPVFDRSAAWWAAAKDFDVFIYVLETEPAQVLDLTGNLDGVPNLRWLRDHATVATRHHTASVLSSRALFSILSSCYPPGNMPAFSKRFQPFTKPGLLSSARSASYTTGIYAPRDSEFGHDSNVFRALGADSLTTGENQPLPYEMTSSQQRQLFDEQAAERMGRDLENYIKSNVRYVMVFLPQIGHAPWADVTGGNEPDLRKRARAIIALQDEWIGKILNIIRAGQRLDRTVFVVTGDHGIRTRQEDPALPSGMMDDYSFHVPFMISTPGLRSTPQYIERLTSHIDMSPSILDLLGISEGREWEQGSPVWEERVRRRRTYFFADDLMGLSGFYQNDKFYMQNRVSGMTAVSSAMHFGVGDTVPEDSEAGRSIHGTLERMFGLEQTWNNRSSVQTLSGAR